ncbi:MAG: BamA/TamA family outer membrane protein [Opitutales bacterium]|nr:BamA/TamA family outer membrane protein [Opitutales bacterium]
MNFWRTDVPVRAVALWILALVLTAAPLAAKTVEVRGHGLFENLRLRNFLRQIDIEPEAETFAPGFVEDGFFLINAQLRRAGYLDPTIRARFLTEDGVEGQSEWARRQSEGLPEVPLQSVRFEIERGVLHFFEAVEIEGLSVVPEREAVGFFHPSGFLIDRRAFRIYSPDRLARGQNNLARRLQVLGYREAAVDVTSLEIDGDSGAVRLVLQVSEGPRYRVRQVRERLSTAAANVGLAAETIVPSREKDVVFSADLERDFATETRNRFFSKGYPDTTVRSGFEIVDTVDGETLVDVRLVVNPGGRARFGEAEFEGLQVTRERYAHSLLDLESGEWLDRVALEEARFRLARLGVFTDVQYTIEPESDGVRNVRFAIEEDARHEFSLTGGWGSYERLRAGFEYSMFNIWGRAHRGDLRFLQTFKGTSGDYVYRIPFLRQAPVSLNFRLAGLQREEVSFKRREFTFEPGLEYRRPGSDQRIGLRYRFQRLRSIFPEESERPGLESARVGSLVLEWSLDRRDMAVAPTDGYRVAVSAEYADTWLGANTTYQRFLWRASYHRELFAGSRVHLRLEQGALTYWGGAQGETPFNRRFFPGGENTVRGFREGGASPRDLDGEILGAEVYTLGTLEWEQRLTPSFSFVFFTDAIVESDRIGDYPGDTFILTGGGGLRYSTPLGPLRLEYGRNFVRRDGDRGAALHLSLGFPF